MGPEQGVTLPGMTIVCGDSHTATRRIRRAGVWHQHLQVEHVLATQTLKQGRAKTMSEVKGTAAPRYYGERYRAGDYR